MFEARLARGDLFKKIIDCIKVKTKIWKSQKTKKRSTRTTGTLFYGVFPCILVCICSIFLFLYFKELCKDINFDVAEDGMTVQAMDNSHVALVQNQNDKQWEDYATKAVK